LRGLSFALGFALGLFLCASAVAGVAHEIADRGVRVEIETRPVSRRLGDEIEAQAMAALPQLLKRAADELPALVGGRASEALGGCSLRVSGVDVPLPPAVARAVGEMTEEAARRGFESYVEGLDLRSIAESFASGAESAVDSALRSEIDGRRLSVEVFGGWSIPVWLDARDDGPGL